ncbi:MAG: CBS domain-containing protein [Nitrososphaerota archaeon]|nr:CBS domain-containing protein [Nitrososphaerota archaeon]
MTGTCPVRPCEASDEDLEDDLAREAIRKLSVLNARAAVVVDGEDKPVATLLMHDIIGLSAREMSTMDVSEIPLADVVRVRESEPGLNLTTTFRETNVPIVAVVDANGKMLGTILEREILRKLVESLGEEEGKEAGPTEQ